MKSVGWRLSLLVTLSLIQRSFSFSTSRQTQFVSVSPLTIMAAATEPVGDKAEGQPLLVSIRERLDCDPTNSKTKLILASQSPRRREILDMMGLSEDKEYIVEVSPLDESKLQVELAKEKLLPVEYTRRLAEAKAFALAEAHASSDEERADNTKVRYYLGSDTIVELDESILEKPKDAEDAKRMLTKMSGQKHRVHTGVALYRLGISSNDCDEEDANQPSLLDSFTDTACVRFTDLTEEDIDAYILSGEPMDKAGSYGIQGRLYRTLSKIPQ
jgi:septum formation protein